MTVLELIIFSISIELIPVAGRFQVMSSRFIFAPAESGQLFLNFLKRILVRIKTTLLFDFNSLTSRIYYQNYSNMKRTHDKLYLNEDSSKIKQSFVEVANEIASTSFNTIADVGCATGAFPNYLKKRFSNIRVIGIEYLESLFIEASKNFPDINFIKGNVLDKNSVNQKFDVITMLGVLMIFDDYKLVLENVLSWLNPKGRLIIFNLVSEFDIDVFVKYKPSSINPDLENLESGWNIISLKSLNEVVEANNAKVITCKPFKLDVKLDKQSDVMRSWTESNLDGGKDIFNALHIRQPQKIVTIEKQ